jgi:hypothetical protein
MILVLLVVAFARLSLSFALASQLLQAFDLFGKVSLLIT